MATLELELVVGGLNARVYTSKLSRTRAQDQTLLCDHQKVSSFSSMISGPRKLPGSNLGMVQGDEWARTCDLTNQTTP